MDEEKRIRMAIIRILEKAGWEKAVYPDGECEEVVILSRDNLEVACYQDFMRVTSEWGGAYITATCSYLRVFWDKGGIMQGQDEHYISAFKFKIGEAE